MPLLPVGHHAQCHTEDEDDYNGNSVEPRESVESGDHESDTDGDDAVEAAVEDVGDAVEEDVAEDTASDGSSEGHGGDTGNIKMRGLEGGQSAGDGETYHADGIDEDKERLGLQLSGVESVPQEQGSGDPENKIDRERMGERNRRSINQNISDDPASKGGEESSDVDAEKIETVAPGDVVAAGREGDDPEGFGGLEEHGEPLVCWVLSATC